MSRRIGCHTAYQHYEMFHGHKACCNGGGSSIFNVVYNTGHHCCGGSSWGGGFWGGIGMGLGMGIANFFGGIFGNMFGGMFGGGMGFGFPGFGGGFDNFWGGGGGGGSRVDNDSIDGTHSNKKCKDKDLDKINSLLDEIKDVDTEAKAKELNDELKKLIKKPLDSAHKAENKTTYEKLLRQLKDKATEKGWNLDGEAKAAPEKAEVTATDVTPATTTPVDNTPKEGEVTIGGKKLNIDDIESLEDLKGLTPEELAKLSADDIKKILEKLGIEEGCELKGKFATTYEALLLLEKAGISVKIAKNTHSSVAEENGGEPWITGKVKDVTPENGTQKLSYTVDCECCGIKKNTYKFEKENDNQMKVTVTKLGPNTYLYEKGKKTAIYNIEAEEPLLRNGMKITTSDKKYNKNIL